MGPDGTRRDVESNCFKAIDSNSASCKRFSIASIGFKSLFPLSQAQTDSGLFRFLSSMSSVCPPVLHGKIEEFHRASIYVRAQMGVPHRHLDGGMTHELLYGLEWHTAHHQVTRKRMSKVMPG